MINYSIKQLANGLTVITHRDRSSKLAAVNILYKVGARNENPQRTGFAHLFEHLMFRGTKAVPDFDIPVQEACGENNAFTNNDYTDYYITLPKDNIETAFWLESDRMTGLDISPEALATEKKVVIEEYNQRYLNQPYGDQWLLLRELAYRVHPYRWATIGRSIDHIADATIEDVREFYRKWYNPGNAILSVAGDLPEDLVLEMAEKWFGDLTGETPPRIVLPEEPVQEEQRRLEVYRQVPAPSLTMAFKMGDRMSRQYYVCDLISDILAGGTSSRLYQRLVKEKQIFSAINAYISGDMDPGLLIVSGHIHENVTVEQAELSVWEEVRKLAQEEVSGYELEKVKNKFEAGILYGELNVMNKAMNLGFYNMLGDMELLNGEIPIFRSITAREVMDTAGGIFSAHNCSILIYLPEK